MQVHTVETEGKESSTVAPPFHDNAPLRYPLPTSAGAVRKTGSKMVTVYGHAIVGRDQICLAVAVYYPESAIRLHLFSPPCPAVTHAILKLSEERHWIEQSFV